MKTLRLTFEDKPFTKLKKLKDNMKEENKEVKNWEDFILKSAGVTK